jgi:hypothetical protein
MLLWPQVTDSAFVDDSKCAEQTIGPMAIILSCPSRGPLKQLVLREYALGAIDRMRESFSARDNRRQRQRLDVPLEQDQRCFPQVKTDDTA